VKAPAANQYFPGVNAEQNAARFPANGQPNLRLEGNPVVLAGSRLRQKPEPCTAALNGLPVSRKL
jgi:hypothetical protein